MHWTGPIPEINKKEKKMGLFTLHVITIKERDCPTKQLIKRAMTCTRSSGM